MGAVETPSILIVDDEPTNLMLLRRMLSREDAHPLIEAVNGQQTLDTARANPELGLILLDVQLPDINGIEVCRTLKNDPATAAIPIVLISAVQTDDASIAYGLDAGADGYLAKPVEETALRAWLRATLRIGALERALREQREPLPKDRAEVLDHFSRLSHAVNNPLQSLIAGADLLALDLEDRPDAVEALEEIQADAERAARLVAQASLQAKDMLKEQA